MKVVIFLGAGASKTEGAPLQNEILKKYFQKRGSIDSLTTIAGNQLFCFLGEFYNIMGFNETSFPTLEEILGIIDIAERRNESFKEYNLENSGVDTGRLRMMRFYLSQILAQVIKENLKDRNGVHDTLIQNILNNKLDNDITFISTNYDTLIDNAIIRQVDINEAAPIDYGVNFTNPTRENDWKKVSNQSINLYKIHGSLNWLYCSVCNTLTLSVEEKGVTELNKATEDLKCIECENLLSPIIIPPTYFKEMSNVFISQIWFQVEKSLKNADHIIFCGYSFPDADIHIKYLLKRAQVNTTELPFNKRFTVINNHENKTEESKKIEKNRYQRFLGKNVDYTQLSFDKFATAPQKIIKNA